MNDHVTSFFLSWLDQSAEDRRAVDEHLSRCPACSAYYEKMSLLFTQAGNERGGLRPDPYLPARIVAGAQASPTRIGVGFVLRWSGASALLVLAVLIGITFGKDLAKQSTAYSTTDIVNTYYSAVSQQSFSTRLESVIESAQKDNK